MEGPSIKEYFKGKNLFFTGGTGFIGKALVEKLLRSCPDLEKIYLLMRPKKGQSIHERLEKITSSSLFDSLRSTYPDNIKKIIPVNGDSGLLGLGISEEDKQRLVNEVNIFFHIAASVRFDDYLKDAIITNVRSTREAAMIALEMKRIEAFMHVSTTYCNINNRTRVEPVLYPPYGDWRELITIAEKCDPYTLNILTQKCLDGYPNTYTYTKQIAEHCIKDLLTGKIPTVIFRPSVVISSYKEPFPGWTDNFNGPAGLLIAGATGMLRSLYADRNAKVDYIPVDNLIKSMIVIAWHKALTRTPDELAIYHGSCHDLIRVTLDTVIEEGQKLRMIIPIEKKIWYPAAAATACWYNYYINVLIFHMLPAFFLDILIRLAGNKPMLVKIQRKIYIANMSISHFMLNEWEFINKTTMALQEFIPDFEMEEFRYDLIPENDKALHEYYTHCSDQARQILLKEGKNISQKTRDITLGMYYLDKACHWIFYAVTFWLFFYKINILLIIWQKIVCYWTSL